MSVTRLDDNEARLDETTRRVVSTVGGFIGQYKSVVTNYNAGGWKEGAACSQSTKLEVRRRGESI